MRDVDVHYSAIHKHNDDERIQPVRRTLHEIVVGENIKQWENGITILCYEHIIIYYHHHNVVCYSPF